MNLEDRKGLKNRARRALSVCDYSPRRLVMLYAGAIAAVTLICALITLALQSRIDNTSGLGSLTLRTNLETFSSIAGAIPGMLTIFWNVGFAWTMLRIARGETVEPGNLGEGFRRFWPVVRLALFQLLLCAGVMMLAFYAAAFLFMMTPLSDEAVRLLMPLAQSGTGDLATLDPAAQAALTRAVMPMILLWLLLALGGVLLVVTYPLRFATFALLDDTGAGALAAMRTSRYLLRYHKGSLLKLDLSFWWYYAAQILVALLCNLDMLLTAAGVALPVSPTAAWILSYGLSLAAQFTLYTAAKNQVDGTYVQFYEALRHPPEEEPCPAPVRQPWTY